MPLRQYKYCYEWMKGEIFLKLDIFKIKMAMAKAEKGVHEIAEAMGCTDQNVRRILSTDSCSLKTLGRLAKAIGCNPEDLVTIDE